MNKARRDFNALSFCRKMGIEGLTQYIRTIHAEPDPFLAILEDNQQPEEERLSGFWKCMESEANAHWQRDSVDLPLINDMAGEKGFGHLRRICEENPGLESLLTPETTPHSLAMNLFLKSPSIFNSAHATFYIDYLEGWQVYPGKGVSHYVDDLEAAKAKFCEEVRDAFKKIGYGNAMHVDVYHRPKRLILDVKYAGPLTRQEGFDQSGRIQGQTMRKPLDISLAYYPSSTVLKVKTPHGLDALNKAIHEAFARSYLKQPDALLALNSARFINLEEFKTRRDFPCDAADGIRAVQVTGVYLSTSLSASTSLTLRDKNGVMPILRTYPIDMEQAVFKHVTIQFEFEGKGRGRFRSATLKHTNAITTDNTDRDAIIEACLKRWGVLHG